MHRIVGRGPGINARAKYFERISFAILSKRMHDALVLGESFCTACRQFPLETVRFEEIPPGGMTAAPRDLFLPDDCMITNAMKTTKKAKIDSIKTEATKPAATKPSKPRTNGICLELIKPDAKHVLVAGSFNEWKPEATPLVRKGNGKWVGDLSVGPGRYEYLFVVDGQWIPDPNAKETVQNPFGGRNSVLVVPN